MHCSTARLAGSGQRKTEASIWPYSPKNANTNKQYQGDDAFQRTTAAVYHTSGGCPGWCKISAGMLLRLSDIDNNSSMSLQPTQCYHCNLPLQLPTSDRTQLPNTCTQIQHKPCT
jgi:hypothetical protein